MTDIIERLRTQSAFESYADNISSRICAEAADEIERLRDVLDDVHNTLDQYLGDTDPDWPPEWTDEEIKEEMPIFWCCRKSAPVHDGQEPQ